jgi:hypothetical protein
MPLPTVLTCLRTLLTTHLVNTRVPILSLRNHMLIYSHPRTSRPFREGHLDLRVQAILIPTRSTAERSRGDRAAIHPRHDKVRYPMGTTGLAPTVRKVVSNNHTMSRRDGPVTGSEPQMDRIRLRRSWRVFGSPEHTILGGPRRNRSCRI